jgi:hypothetical protein
VLVAAKAAIKISNQNFKAKTKTSRRQERETREKNLCIEQQQQQQDEEIPSTLQKQRPSAHLSPLLSASLSPNFLLQLNFYYPNIQTHNNTEQQ